MEGLRRSGCDTVQVEIWSCGIAEALLRLLAQKNGRSWEAIEEAHVYWSLVHEMGLSQSEVARRVGCSVSLVNWWLMLLEAMPEEALHQGLVTTWTATRILVPLARAKAEHARSLIKALEAQPMSTCELRI